MIWASLTRPRVYDQISGQIFGLIIDTFILPMLWHVLVQVYTCNVSEENQSYVEI